MAQVKTEREMFPLVENWLQSGLTQKQFTRKHKLPKHVFYYWVARYRKTQSAQTTSQSPAKTVPTFIRLATPDAHLDSPAANTVVELPSGVVVRFTTFVPVAYLKELVS